MEGSGRKYSWVLWIVNLGVAAFFAVAYLSFTSRMALEEGASPDVIYTAQGGMKQVLYRYACMRV